MKKICILLALLLSMSFTLAACNDSGDTSSADLPQSSTSPTLSDEPSSEEPSSEASSEASSEQPSEEESSEPEKEPVTMPEITDFVLTDVTKNAGVVSITVPEMQEAGHKASISMIKTAWGTWNLGYYKVTDKSSNVTVTMNPGGTDWEYVYRVTDKASGGTMFCGGNHGNEKLIDITFYDAKTGEELGSGDESFHVTEVNGLRVVEHTQIYYHEQPDKPFVNVTRNYLINGNDVWLECDYDFIHTSYFNLSYTGMFCVPKISGNHVIYENVDGTTREWVTKTNGTLDGSPNFVGVMDYGNPAASVHIYGDETPEFRMNIEIYDTETMAGNFASKEQTFMWDMSSTQNKLYFSVFDGTKNHRVESGTHWDTLIRWSFYKAEADGEQ